MTIFFAKLSKKYVFFINIFHSYVSHSFLKKLFPAQKLKNIKVKKTAKISPNTNKIKKFTKIVFTLLNIFHSLKKHKFLNFKQY